MFARHILAASAAILAGAVGLPAFAQTSNCSANDEVSVPPHMGVTFQAEQHRDEKSKFSLMSNRKGRWLTDEKVQNVSFEDHAAHRLDAQANLYSASASGFCVKAPGWWQWGGGPQNHQDWVRVTRTVTTHGAVINYYEDASDDPGGILTMTFHRED